MNLHPLSEMKEINMSTPIKIDQPAPNFILETFEGESVELSEFKNEKIVFLVFNRGFT